MGAALKKQLNKFLDNPKDKEGLKALAVSLDKDKNDTIDEQEFASFVDAMVDVMLKRGPPVGE